MFELVHDLMRFKSLVWALLHVLFEWAHIIHIIIHPPPAYSFTTAY